MELRRSPIPLAKRYTLKVIIFCGNRQVKSKKSEIFFVRFWKKLSGIFEKVIEFFEIGSENFVGDLWEGKEKF